MPKTLYTRIEARNHRLLSAYAARWGLTLQIVVERAVDMILFQVDEQYEPAPWLVEAIESGDLDLQRCGEDETKITVRSASA
jgi:hypothetical protein